MFSCWLISQLFKMKKIAYILLFLFTTTQVATSYLLVSQTNKSYSINWEEEPATEKEKKETVEQEKCFTISCLIVTLSENMKNSGEKDYLIFQSPYLDYITPPPDHC